MINDEHKLIAGAGGGGGKSGGSSSGHTATEDPDTLQSRAMVSVLDLIGEGQIGGLVDGAKSVYLGDLPLMNSDNTYNFKGVSWEMRNGTQDQTPIKGFNGVETPYNANTQIKNTAPFTFAISNPNADQVRCIMTLPALTSTDTKTGDTHGAEVQYKFQISNNGGSFVDIAPIGESTIITLRGKKNGKYQRAHMFNLPKPGSNYQMKVIRLTADNTSTYLQNDTYLDSYYEIVDAKLSYPNSVLFGISIDSSQFSKIPDRAYLVDGLYIRVPTNYDPTTGNYSGTWDGTFKLAVSSNPAWILYDLLLNTRYGLGSFISASMINRGKLYQIGRYCDGLVSNGRGGQERRFQINTVIATRNDAYKVIQDIASAFRGMVFWGGGVVNATQDSPADPVQLFSNSNVIDGMFTYTGTARKDRHSVALITYNDPNDNYKQAIEYVEDPDLIKKFGVRKTESVAFGCTSRGQAHRVGQWILYSEKAETDVIYFKAGLDSAFVIPGDIVKIQDQYRAGRRMSGRLLACTATTATLDAPVTLASGANMISLMMPDGTFVDRTIVGAGTMSTITFTAPITSGLPVANAIWIITQPDLKPVLARVIEVKQGEDLGTVEIACTAHNPSKFDAIEQGMMLDIPDNTVLDPTYSTPENLVIDETTYFSSPGNLGTKLHVSWDGKSPNYIMSWRRSDVVSNWTNVPLKITEFELEGVLENAKYDFSVVGVSVTGKVSDALVGTYTVLGSTNPPGPPTSLTATGDFRSVLLKWANPANLDLDHIEIYENSVNDSATASMIARVTGTQFTRGGLPGLVTRWYWAKAVNKRGLQSQFNSNLGTQATTLQATHDDVVKQFVDSSMLVPELVAGFEANQGLVDQLQSYFDKASQVEQEANALKPRLAVLEAWKASVDDGTTQYVTQEQLLQAKNETQQAVIDNMNAVMTGPSGAIARAVNNLKTEVDGKFSALKITAETVNGLQSQYTVKIDNNGYVAGFGLASDSSTGVPTSEFMVLADRFAIAQPNQGSGASYPFIVTSVNGVPRVSMNSAFITEIIAAILKSPDNKFRIDLQNKLISIEV